MSAQHPLWPRLLELGAQLAKSKPELFPRVVELLDLLTDSEARDPLLSLAFEAFGCTPPGQEGKR